MNTLNLPQSSYSLPPTPLTSSFEDFSPSSKRRRTQRAVNSEDKTFPSKGSLETPTHRAFSEPSQILKSAKPIRNSNLTRSASQSSQVPDSEEAVTPSSSKSIPAVPSEQLQTEQTLTLRKPPSRNKTITVKPEPTEASKDATDSPMGSAMSHSGNARKSMSTRLDGVRHEKETPYKVSTLNTSNPTPQSSRRDRRSRLAANTGAKITKAPPATKAQITSTVAGAKTKDNGVNKSTPPKQHKSQTPTTSTRPRRRDRKSTKANEETPGLKQGAESVAVHASDDDEHVRSHRSRLSNTVTLNVGRKPLESILAQQSKQDSHDDTINGEETPGQIESDYHVEYDSEMYKNNFGLDGQMEGPTSPESMSTTTSTAARTSGRTRKPTIRALESFESEQRYRRPRAPSAKPSTPADTAANTKRRSKQKSSPQSPASTSQPTNPPDINAIAKQLYELAAAAVAPDFVSAPEVDTWLKELQEKLDKKTNEKEAESPPSAGGEADEGRESMPPPSKPFSDSVQASEPRTDEDGWVHTGHVNKHGEEYVIVPDNFEWYRPNYTYGDKNLPPPPVRLRTFAQAEKDRVFGYPPCIGERNLPADNQPYFLLENVPEEKAKLELKEAARARGIYITRFMPREELETLIHLHDNGLPPPIAPSRKRRRPDTTSTSKFPESTETPKSKRRRQGAEHPPPPEPSAGGEPESPERKSLRITLTFGNKRLLLEEAAPTDSTTSDRSKKRPHSEVEDDTTKKIHGHDTQSPKIQKISTTTTNEKPPPSMPAPSTPGPKSAEEKKVTPFSSEHFSTETTSGGRPRRRASAALMAEFQTHAEDRARRSERARLAHARRKGTPLKNVTSLNDNPVETPIRPAINPVSVD